MLPKNGWILSAFLGLFPWYASGQSDLEGLPPAVTESAEITPAEVGETSGRSRLEPESDATPVDIKSLMRPRFNLSVAWAPDVDGFMIGSYDLSLRVPTYPVFGPPPPIIASGYSLTQIDSPDGVDLPSNLHEFSLGVGWMRRINEKWMARLMLSGAFASDLENNSSDAWQVRGGGFALYRPNDRWSFAFGVLATGRDDLPVLPAIGAIWEPSRAIIVNLTMPTPRVSFLLRETVTRQHWGYIGGAISGGTWAFDRVGGIRERLSYNEFRLALGWESGPPRLPGSFRPSGKTVGAEIGYAFGREFEFDSGAPDVDFDDAVMFRTQIRF